MPGKPRTRISRAYPDRVEVRGRYLAGDLMGRLTFTEYFHLLLTGREPTEEPQGRPGDTKGERHPNDDEPHAEDEFRLGVVWLALLEGIDQAAHPDHGVKAGGRLPYKQIECQGAKHNQGIHRGSWFSGATRPKWSRASPTR